MPTISKAQVLELFAELKPRLAQDPLFVGSGNLETFTSLVAQLPATVEQLFGETLQGDSEAYRYAGLLLCAELVHRFAGHQVFTHNGDLVIDDSKVTFYRGDLWIKGNLVLGDQTIVVVAGDLDIEGNFVGGPWDYSLLGVTGTMSAVNAMTQGELIVTQRLSIRDAAYFYRNSYSTVAPAVRTRVLVENERFDTFGKINAEQQVSELLTSNRPEQLQRVASLLGVDGINTVDDLEYRLRRRLCRSAG